MHNGHKSIVDLAIAIILSLYETIDLECVALVITLKIVYSSHTNLDDAVNKICGSPLD